MAAVAMMARLIERVGESNCSSLLSPRGFQEDCMHRLTFSNASVDAIGALVYLCLINHKGEVSTT